MNSNVLNELNQAMLGLKDSLRNMTDEDFLTFRPMLEDEVREFDTILKYVIIDFAEIREISLLSERVLQAAQSKRDYLVHLDEFILELENARKSRSDFSVNL